MTDLYAFIGTLIAGRQGEIIRSLAGSTEPEQEVAAEIVRDVLNKLRRARVTA